jgi:hypothetical protein
MKTRKAGIERFNQFVFTCFFEFIQDTGIPEEKEREENQIVGERINKGNP